MIKEDKDKEQADSIKINQGRRDMIKKYGAYTAPVVVSLLAPQHAYGANGGVVYSSASNCINAHTMTPNAAAHCVSAMAMHLG